MLDNERYLWLIGDTLVNNSGFPGVDYKPLTSEEIDGMSPTERARLIAAMEKRTGKIAKQVSQSEYEQMIAKIKPERAI